MPAITMSTLAAGDWKKAQAEYQSLWKETNICKGIKPANSQFVLQQ